MAKKNLKNVDLGTVSTPADSDDIHFGVNVRTGSTAHCLKSVIKTLALF